MTDDLLEAFAQLRVGMDQNELMKLMRIDNPDLEIPGEPESGYLFHRIYREDLCPAIPFCARITKDGRIGYLKYSLDFPGEIKIDGLQISMDRAEVLELVPEATPSPDNSSIEYQHEGYIATRPDGSRIAMVFQNNRLFRLEFELTGAAYPGDMLSEANKVYKGLEAYDLEILHRFVDPEDNVGWVFGLPPGITPQQWPLDPISGYPLMHGFTLLLPKDYRVHGPDIVALSFFATAFDQNDGGAEEREDLQAAVLGEPASEEESGDLKPFRDHAAHSHPRLYRMTDILDYSYAVILLTMEEFSGQLCLPPQFYANPYLTAENRPEWMDAGSAHTYFGFEASNLLPIPDHFIYKVLGAVPEKNLQWHRAIAITPRKYDPNAGIPPADEYASVQHGYEQPYDPNKDYEEKDWVKDFKSNHIGGTMIPVQATPEFSPFYVEFEEYFGGYNFGGGNAQLDFLQMRFDWACG